VKGFAIYTTILAQYRWTEYIIIALCVAYLALSYTVNVQN